MTDLLLPDFWRRLHALRLRLALALRRSELTLENATGRSVSPEVASHRPYVPGDDPRAIDWSLFARTDRYFVKTPVREEEGLVYLLVDASRSLSDPYPEKRTLELELAAAFGFLMLCAGNRVVVCRWCDRLLSAGEPLRGEGQAVRLLRELNRGAEADGETDLDAALTHLLALRRGARGAALVLSDFFDVSAFGRKVAWLRSHDVAVGGVQVLHPNEAKLKLRGNLALEDPETGRRAELLLGYGRLKALQRALEEHLEQTRRTFTGQGGRFHRALTGTPFENAVLGYFRAGRAGA